MERKNSYCHFPIQNLKAKLPYIGTHIKIKLCPNYSITPYPPHQSVSGILFMGKKALLYITVCCILCSFVA